MPYFTITSQSDLSEMTTTIWKPNFQDAAEYACNVIAASALIGVRVATDAEASAEVDRIAEASSLRRRGGMMNDNLQDPLGYLYGDPEEARDYESSRLAGLENMADEFYAPRFHHDR